MQPDTPFCELGIGRDRRHRSRHWRFGTAGRD